MSPKKNINSNKKQNTAMENSKAYTRIECNQSKQCSSPNNKCSSGTNMKASKFSCTVQVSGAVKKPTAILVFAETARRCLGWMKTFVPVVAITMDEDKWERIPNANRWENVEGEIRADFKKLAAMDGEGRRVKVKVKVGKRTHFKRVFANSNIFDIVDDKDFTMEEGQFVLEVMKDLLECFIIKRSTMHPSKNDMPPPPIGPAHAGACNSENDLSDTECNLSDTDVMCLMEQPPSVARKESAPLPQNSSTTTERKEKIPVSLPPKLKPFVKPGQYEVRIIIHSVHGASTFGEFFPDVYVKARMMNVGSDWCRTDVHKNSVGGVALFEYRLVLPLFRYPVRKGAKRKLDPILHLVVMDEDRYTSDDKIGSIRLNLEDLPAPDELESCSLASLNNETVNLFDPSAIKMIRSESATFQRQLTGHWPAIRKKLFNRELKATCSVLMTIQLLSASEAARTPVDSGNKEGPRNRFPRLIRPKREHGKILDKLLNSQVEMLEAIIEYITGIPSIMGFVVVVILIAASCWAVPLRPLAKYAEGNTMTTVGIAFSCGVLLAVCMQFCRLFTDSSNFVEANKASSAKRVCDDNSGGHRKNARDTGRRAPGTQRTSVHARQDGTKGKAASWRSA